MTNIKGIIATHRTRLESAGLLRRATAAQLSSQVKSMRPSLAKVRAALQERPDRFKIVQPSPMAMLFEVTLPAIEHVLIELGEERAEQIIGRLCEHGRAMIDKYGIKSSQEHLEGLFKDLSNYEANLREESGLEGIIEAYQRLDFESFDFEDKGIGYFDLKNKLIELLGKVKAYKIIIRLYEYGIAVIAEYGAERSQEHLEELFEDLPEYEKKLKKENGLEEIIGAYHESRFEGRHEGYLRLKFGDKILKLEINDEGMFSLEMASLTTDSDLIHLQRVASLQKLGLGKTQVSDAGLAHLQGFINLQMLNLRGTRVSDAGLVYLKSLTNLQGLYLLSTQVSDAGLVHLEGLTNLQSLNLSDTQVSDAGLAHLKGLADLQSLVLWGTQVSDAGIVHLQSFTNLEVLNLRFTQVSDAALADLKGLTNLQSLDLWETQVSDAGLAHLQGFTNLEMLNLRGTQIRDLTSLSGLTNLKSLNLGKTQVSDINPLSCLTSLGVLFLEGTQVSDAQVEKLKKTIPGLEVIK